MQSGRKAFQYGAGSPSQQSSTSQDRRQVQATSGQYSRLMSPSVQRTRQSTTASSVNKTKRPDPTAQTPPVTLSRRPSMAGASGVDALQPRRSNTPSRSDLHQELPATPRSARQENRYEAPSGSRLSSMGLVRPSQTQETTRNTYVRPVSPATSIASSKSTSQRNGVRRSLIPVASPSPSFRRSASRMGSSPPPVPTLPSQESIAEKEREVRLTQLRTMLQTPEPTLRARASQMPFYSGRRSTAGQTPQGPGSFAQSPSFNRRVSGEQGRHVSASSREAAPSAWKEQPRMRPGSAMSVRSRAGAATPLPTAQLHKAWIPNTRDPLDMELSVILGDIPHDVHVERLDPPLRKGQVHTGEWTAQYAFASGRHGRRVFSARLLELHKTRNNERVRKVMVRIDGLWRDVRLVLLEMA
jgi:hypothetical protein